MSNLRFVENVYAHGLAGGVLLTSASAYPGRDVGQSPESIYVGFKVLAANTTIDSWGSVGFDVDIAPNEGIANLTLTVGETYWIPFQWLKLGAGSVYLIKG